MNYTDLVSTISNLTVIKATDPNFVQILPQGIAYAEDRLYRELDLLSTVVKDTASVTVGSPYFTLPQNAGRFVVTNGFNVVTPATTSDPVNGTVNQLTPVSLDYMNVAWTSSAGSSVPKVYAPLTDQIFVLGPWPDALYTIQVIGVVQPAPLSVSNPTSYLSLYLPDLLTAAVMIFMAGYQQNFGAQSDNPQMAVSWSSEYDKLFASANVIQQRQRYAAGGWSSLSPTPVATPTR